MSGRANIVEQYAGADVPARIELLIKYYPKAMVNHDMLQFVSMHSSNIVLTR